MTEKKDKLNNYENLNIFKDDLESVKDIETLSQLSYGGSFGSEKLDKALKEIKELEEIEREIKRHTDTVNENLISEKDAKENKLLIIKAQKARKNAYAPYSNFKVGACLLTKTGKYFTGVNVENASYSATVCAERSAFFEAIKNGEKAFKKIAIVGGKSLEEFEFCPPCGICRQVMNEFCKNEDFEVILATDIDEYNIFKLKDLFPLGFDDNIL